MRLILLVTFVVLLGCGEHGNVSSKAPDAIAVGTRRDESDLVRFCFVLPDRKDQTSMSSAKTFGLTAPVFDGVSDPNLIVYDDEYVNQYVDWAVNGATICGAAAYTIITPDGVIEVQGGLDASYLGSRFRQESLLRFLEARISGPAVEKEFMVDISEFPRLPEDGSGPHENRRLRDSPWDRDVRTVTWLLALAQCKRAYSLFAALASDSAPTVRTTAVMALGRIADVEPRAIDELTRLMSHPHLTGDASDALAIAGEAGVSALIEAMDSTDADVRHYAVFALGRVSQPEAAARGIVAALKHPDPQVRESGTAVLLDALSRGKRLPSEQLSDVLASRLLDGDAGHQAMILKLQSALEAQQPDARETSAQSVLKSESSPRSP